MDDQERFVPIRMAGIVMVRQMNARLTQMLTIDVGQLLKVHLQEWTVVPFLMVFTVVFKMSVELNILEMHALSYLVLAMSLLSFFVMSAINVRTGFISRYVAAVVLFQALMLASTFIGGTDIKDCLYQSCLIIFIAMVSDHFKERFHFLVAAFALSFSFCAYLNFYHLMTHPDLWIVDDLKSTQGYILGGNYNSMGCRLLCAVGMSMVCLKYSKWWLLNAVPVTLVSIATLGIVKSMTALSGIMLLLLFCLIPSRKLLKAGIAALIAAVILFQILVCFQGKGIENNALAAWFVEDVLGKDITFTHRTYMWDAASKVFGGSPLIGYGLVDAEWYYTHMSTYAKGPHNFIWGLLLYGGIALLAVFTYICYMAFIKLPATGDKYILLIYATAAVMFLMMLMEVYPPPFILTLLSLAFFAPRSQESLKLEATNTN